MEQVGKGRRSVAMASKEIYKETKPEGTSTPKAADRMNTGHADGTCVRTADTKTHPEISLEIPIEP